jgi:hypothetical protein
LVDIAYEVHEKLRGLKTIGCGPGTIGQNGFESSDRIDDACAVLAIGVRIVGRSVVGDICEMPGGAFGVTSAIIVGPTGDR